MTYTPNFSIIMPSKNRCHLIWKAVLSVINQTYPFWELLIIDDGSNDKTKLTVAQFTDPRIKYQKNDKSRGPAAARNQGLKKAKGEYIAYLDDDNTWHPEFLEIMNAAYQSYPDKILIYCKKNFRLKVINADKKIDNIRDEFTQHKKYFDLKRLWARKIIIDTNTLTHRKKEVIGLGGWDEKLPFWEDYELTLNISTKYPDGFLALNRTLVDYEELLDFSQADKAIKKWEQAEKYIFEKYKDHPLIKHQKWFPPNKHKSTLSVVEFLQSKKVG